MNDSILTTIKKALGLAEEYTVFDPDIIMHINTVFMILNQLGVGPEEGFYIEDESSTWDDYIDEDDDLQAVKSYISLKVKLLFDPPLSSSVEKSYKDSISELEWRLNINAD